MKVLDVDSSAIVGLRCSRYHGVAVGHAAIVKCVATNAATISLRWSFVHAGLRRHGITLAWSAAMIRVTEGQKGDIFVQGAAVLRVVTAWVASFARRLTNGAARRPSGRSPTGHLSSSRCRSAASIRLRSPQYLESFKVAPPSFVRSDGLSFRSDQLAFALDRRSALLEPDVPSKFADAPSPSTPFYAGGREVDVGSPGREAFRMAPAAFLG